MLNALNIRFVNKAVRKCRKQDCRNEKSRIAFISGSRHIQIAAWAHAVPVDYVELMGHRTSEM